MIFSKRLGFKDGPEASSYTFVASFDSLCMSSNRLILAACMDSLAVQVQQANLSANCAILSNYQLLISYYCVFRGLL